MDSTPFPPPQPPYQPPAQPAYPPSAQAPSTQPPYQPPAPVYGPPTYGQPTYGPPTAPAYGYPGQPVPPGGSAGRPPRRRLPWWSWALGGIGGLLIVCCVLGTVITLAQGHGLAGSPSASSTDATATDTQALAPQPTATSASVAVVSQPTDTPVPAPQPSATTAPAPQSTNTPVPATIRAGWYQVTLHGQAGPNTFSLPATLAVFAGAYKHPVDICLGTGGVTSPVVNQAPGVIYFQSNSTCVGLYGGGTGPGATAGYDDGFVTANIPAGTVEVDPDPTHCCNYSLSPNNFDTTTYAYSTNPIARGYVKLQFSSNGSVSGTIALASCQVNPYCSDAEAVFYTATLAGNFAHS